MRTERKNTSCVCCVCCVCVCVCGVCVGCVCVCVYIYVYIGSKGGRGTQQRAGGLSAVPAHRRPRQFAILSTSSQLDGSGVVEGKPKTKSLNSE